MTAFPGSSVIFDCFTPGLLRRRSTSLALFLEDYQLELRQLPYLLINDYLRWMMIILSSSKNP